MDSECIYNLPEEMSPFDFLHQSHGLEFGFEVEERVLFNSFLVNFIFFQSINKYISIEPIHLDYFKGSALTGVGSLTVFTSFFHISMISSVGSA
jgi:hypothetical protein